MSKAQHFMKKKSKHEQQKARGIIPGGTDVALCVRPSVVLLAGNHERTVGLSVMWTSQNVCPQTDLKLDSNETRAYIFPWLTEPDS
jgi:hypothetical protein